MGDVSDPMYIMLRAFDFCLEQDRKLLESSEKKNDRDCRRLLPALWRIDYRVNMETGKSIGDYCDK